MSDVYSHNRTFIKVGPDREILEESYTDIPLRPPWVDVTDIPKLSGWSYEQKWYDEKNHEIKIKTEIELHVGATLFLSDGKDKCCISVRGEQLDSDDPVIIMINNDRYEISESEDINLVSDQAGRFVVKISDPKYFANPNAYTIFAEAPEDEETD